ncbi:hypothetical protein K380107A5_21890 [Holdemania massiliensis]
MTNINVMGINAIVKVFADVLAISDATLYLPVEISVVIYEKIILQNVDTNAVTKFDKTDP